MLSATIGSFGLGTVLSWSAIALKSIEESKAFGDISNESKWIASLALVSFSTNFLPGNNRVTNEYSQIRFVESSEKQFDDGNSIYFCHSWEL